MPDSIITKNAIAESLKMLMKGKTFEKISVGEICENCGITRKSFYYHFRDKYDLVAWIFTHDFLSEVQIDTYQDFLAFLDDLVTYFYSERQFYRIALATQGQNCFRDTFVQILRPIVTRFAEDLFVKCSPQELQCYISFFCGGLVESIKSWLDSDIELSDFIETSHYVIKQTSDVISRGQK